MVDELVPRDADEPGDAEVRDRVALNGLHRREKRLGGEIFGDRLVADPGPEVSEYLRQRPVIHREQRRPLIRWLALLIDQ